MRDSIVNPYDAPNAENVPPAFDSLSDVELVERLLDDALSDHEVQSDAADINFYGSRRKRRIQGTAADRLSQHGLQTTIYQSIRWWCLVYVPVIPLGTFAVVDYTDMLPEGDDHSRVFRVSTDWSQVAFHAMITLFGLTLIAVVASMILFPIADG